MKSHIYLNLILGLLFLVPGQSYALEAISIAPKDSTDAICFYFQFNRDEIIADYLDNQQAIHFLDSLFAKDPLKVQPDSLVITSLVLSEGSPKYNTWLAEHRAEAVRDYLKNHFPQLHTKVVLFRKEVDWMDYRNLIAHDPAIPNREEVLQIIDHHYNDPGKCLQLIRYLNGQKPYHYITEHILPRLHQTKVQVIGAHPELPLGELKSAASTETPGEEAMTSVVDSLWGDSIRKEYDITPFIKPSRWKYVLAIKNNLLYDLVLAPNLEVEIPVGGHWSFNTEFKCPWWLNSAHDFCYQLLSGGVEARLWLGNRRKHDRLLGHFLGLYAEGGQYDFQLGKSEGMQGNYYVAGGLSYGYTKRVASHLSFEFSLGVGYLETEYRKYTSEEGKLIWKDTRRCIYLGPTKVKISLVWLIGAKQ